MKLLSLCIPTYNRVKFLEDSLYAIVTSIPIEFRDKIEIVISNNASSDETRLLLQTFQERYTYLNWIVINQEANIGPSNIIVVTKYASGEFIWILSDDDIVLPNSIGQIVRILLQNPQINGIIVNYAGFQNNHKNLEKPVLEKSDSILDKNEALKHLVTALTFISVLIYRQKNVKINESLLNNSLPQSYIFLEALSSNKIFCIPEVVLGMRIANSGGYDFYEVFLSTFKNVLDYAEILGFDKKAIEFVKRKHLRNHVTVFSIILKSNKSYGDLKINNNLASNLVLEFGKNDFYAKILFFYLKSPNFLSIPINLIRLFRRNVLNLIHKI